jgi:hypothetical protein
MTSRVKSVGQWAMSSVLVCSLVCINERAARSYSSGKKISPIAQAIEMNWMIPLEQSC